MMKASLSFTGGAEGASWRAETEGGHALVIDGAPDIGGLDLGPRPLELMLLGLGGCTAMDVLSILRKKRQRVVDCRIELSAERAEEHPRVFTKIHVHFKVFGDVQEGAIERAIELSHSKYCSAHRMLSATAEITSSFEVIPVDAPGAER
jgi:putative redox protein